MASPVGLVALAQVARCGSVAGDRGTAVGANEQDFTSLSGDAGCPLLQESELLDIIEIEG